MTSLREQTPGYLLDRHQIRMTVVYTALFSLVFLLLSVPFSGETWFALGSNSTFLYTVAFMLSAALAVLVSRWLLGRCRTG